MAELELMRLADWKARTLQGDRPQARLRKAFAAEVVVGKDDVETADARLATFTISTETVDRENDIIRADGWQLENFLKNPVVLWAHSRRDLPIGRATEVAVKDGALVSTAEFAGEDVNPLAPRVFRALQQKFLNAVSVGFVPEEYSWDEQRGGFNFLRHELVEYSVVPVPANPDALQLGRSLPEEDRTALKEWAEATLELVEGEAGLWLPRQAAERVLRLLDGDRLVIALPEGSTLERTEVGEVSRTTVTPAESATATVRLEASALAPLAQQVERLASQLEVIGRRQVTIEERLAAMEVVEELEPLVAESDDDPLRDLSAEAVAELVESAIARSLTAVTGRLP